MVVDLITFASVLHKQAIVRSSHEAILSELEKYSTVNSINYRDISQLPEGGSNIILIVTGEVERLVMQCSGLLPRPAIILADGMQNSLTAVLEVSSWLHRRGTKSEIPHRDFMSIVQRVQIPYTSFKAQRSLVGLHIETIGTPSSRLVASNVDYLLIKRCWGIEYLDIPSERIYDVYDHIIDNEVDTPCAAVASQVLVCHEGTPEDMTKAMHLHRAIKRICKEGKLSAVTLSCFKLIERTGTTGCLALAMLNDRGIITGCKGDLQSVLALLAAKALTGKAGFMVNPSVVNARGNGIILAHCTVGMKQTERYIIHSRLETESGIGIQELLPAGDVTIMERGGECLDECYLSTGALTENTSYASIYRTQARIEMSAPAGYFLKNPFENHHISLQGDYEDALDKFLQANFCKRTE